MDTFGDYLPDCQGSHFIPGEVEKLQDECVAAKIAVRHLRKEIDKWKSLAGELLNALTYSLCICESHKNNFECPQLKLIAKAREEGL